MSCLCPFHFSEYPRPSIFHGDPAFRANKNGHSRSEQQAATVERMTRENGRSPGTISGLSPVGDARLAQQMGW